MTRTRSFALYRTEDDAFFASDGLCADEQVHLSGGLLMGHLIECQSTMAGLISVTARRNALRLARRCGHTP